MLCDKQLKIYFAVFISLEQLIILFNPHIYMPHRIVALILLMLTCFAGMVKAGIIDSLNSKEQVQRFLAANFSEQGFICLNDCVAITQSERNKARLASPLPYTMDTFSVLDPETGEEKLVIKPYERDTVCYCCNDSDYIVMCPLPQLLENIDTNHYFLSKTDIDNNGYTDLVIDAGAVVAIMDMGSKLEGHVLSASSNPKAFLFKQLVALPDGNNAFLFKSTCASDIKNKNYNGRTDTVVYKFGTFTKYNSHVGDKRIIGLTYKYVRSYGDECDVLTCLEIHENGMCFLKYEYYDMVFTGLLDSESTRELIGLVNYIDIISKKDQYYLWSSVITGGSFTVYFDDGTQKTTSVWDNNGPISLIYLSKKLSDISKSIQWNVADKPIEFKCKDVNVNGEDETEDSGCRW